MIIIRTEVRAVGCPPSVDESGRRAARLTGRVDLERRRLEGGQILELPAELLERHPHRRGELRELVLIVDEAERLLDGGARA